MSENDNKKAPYNRPDQRGTNKPYGRPAAGQPQTGERRYGIPAGAPQGQGGGGRSYGNKPAFDRGPQSGERKPFARPAGAPQGQGGGSRSFGKPAFDRGPQSGERKPFARPAGAPQGQGDGGRGSGKPAFDRGPQSGERKPFARPAGAPQGQGTENRSFGKPAFDKGPQSGERKPFPRPAGAPQGQGSGGRSFGKPAFDRGPQSGERKPFARPAGAPQGQGGEGRSFGKPAFGRGPQSGERKPFVRPAGAPQGQGGGSRSFGKPAFDRGPQSGERRQYAKPAGTPQGQGGEGRSYANRPAFDRGAPRPQEGGHRFNKPAFVPDPQGNDRDRRSFSRPAQAPQPQQRFGRPDLSGPARPAGGFRRPASPRPSFNHAAPGRTDFRSQPNDREGTGLSADARKSAMLVLNRVLLESGFASLSLDEHFEKVNLSQKDKRLCTRIVYLTLEHLNQIDFALDRYLEDTEKLEKRVRNILRLSAAQILLLDRIPDSAAVNEAVKLTRDLGLEDLTGLVNGVLRNLIRGREELSFPAKGEGLAYYRVMQSLPEWYAQKVLDAYGQDEGDRLLCYEKQEHYITVRPNLQRISAAKFEELLRKKTWDAKPGILPGVWHVSGASDIGHDNDFLDGLFSIQGEGSMVAAMAVKPKLGAQVLDTCAAPGGKSAFMSEQMQGTGRVQAWDVHEHRVDLIQALADRLRLYNIRPAMRDALVYREQMDRMMDAVLIDAPCTGSGMLFEKPDLRHNLKEESLKELTGIQSKLLDTCSRYVKPGATLVYATCSILPEENHLQIKDFLDTHPEFVMDAMPEEIPANLRELTGEYGLQLLPHRDGMEGFFVARMKRV